MVGALLAATGWTEPGVRLVIRATARTSVALFLAAFLASTLRRRWPGPATSWLLQNRRYVGLGFAVSHLLHLLAILELYDVAPAAYNTGGPRPGLPESPLDVPRRAAGF